MAKKSSKTAHVLNLLSPTIDAEELTPDTPKTEEASTENISSTDDIEALEESPKKADSMEEILHLSNNTEDLSMLIKDNLEKEFEENIIASDTTQEHEIDDQKSQTSQNNSLEETIAPIESVAGNATSAENDIVEDAQQADSPKENSSQEELPTDIEALLASTNMVKSVENALAGDNIAQTAENLSTTDTAKNDEKDDLPDNIEALLASTNMVKSVENALAGDNIAQTAENLIAADTTNTHAVESVENTLTEDTITEDETTTDTSAVNIEETSNENIAVAENKDSGNQQDAIEDIPFYTVNVFETIVKDCVLDYMNRFQVCTCNRCVADVTALALTNLPSKYLVTDFENVAPLLHFLEHKYEVVLMTELTKACLTVHAEPRHNIKK